MDCLAELIKFRESLYSLFPKRKDAIFNLLDALTCHGHQCRSVVQLSNSDYFKRQYSSITDAIADGLPQAAWDKIRKLVYQHTSSRHTKQPHRFIVDCTNNKRPDANKLPDRTITHHPNPAPGNKPICVGHQYSLLSLLPNEILENQKHWLVPLSAKRVTSTQKGNEVGMQQIIECIDELGLQDELSISIGDSLYGTEHCRASASEQANLVHIFRLNSKRNIFQMPAEPSKAVGRKKEFGQKMNLRHSNTHLPCDRAVQTSQLSKKGRTLKIKIKCWDNMLLRGSRQFRSSKYPLNVIQVCVVDDENNAVFKRPLWLGVLGERRHEIELIDCYKHYGSRYDVEHFFRFGKGKLLIDGYQTADVTHEEHWWQLCLLAYVQLYLAKGLVPCLPQPWERYLPEYKAHVQQAQAITTPSQTQRGFTKVLEQIGSPANRCIARGKPRGRMLGESQTKRLPQPVIFKTQKGQNKLAETNLPGFKKPTLDSNPRKIAELIKLIKTNLDKSNLTLTEFAEMLLDSS